MSLQSLLSCGNYFTLVNYLMTHDNIIITSKMLFDLRNNFKIFKLLIIHSNVKSSVLTDTLQKFVIFNSEIDYDNHVAVLLNHGANPNFRFENGMSLLIHSIQNLNVNYVYLLCLHNARFSIDDLSSTIFFFAANFDEFRDLFVNRYAYQSVDDIPNMTYALEDILNILYLLYKNLLSDSNYTSIILRSANFRSFINFLPQRFKIKINKKNLL